jgi:N-6 DNA Methylase
MTTGRVMANEVISAVLELLGYDTSSGYVQSINFGQLKRHRFHLIQCAQHMNVVGAFGLGSASGGTFTPVVLIAQANDEAEAQHIHRLVWSQGLAPFLLVATRDGVYVCGGFAYQAVDWGKDSFIDRLELRAGTSVNVPSPLSQLLASRLRTSLAWRDGLMSVENRVDEAMLADLKRAGDLLVKDPRGYGALTPGQANALIGRILYLHFLVGRDTFEPALLDALGINIDDRGRWNPEWLWLVFDKLDELLNGSIFPMSPQDRASINSDHIELVRGVLGYGDRVYTMADDRGLFRVELSVIRTETLSAIYEQFLRREVSDIAASSDTDSTDAAFYTPPFLVDYMLAELERQAPIIPGKTILDGTAGSGVFLVSCYRRLIERLLSPHEHYLPRDSLIRLMQENIFAIERHRDACHVAAFSLYLVMLEYMDPEEVRALTSSVDHGERVKLFPPIVAPEGNNILERDLFDRSRLPEIFPRRFHIILGNPPWGPVTSLRDPIHVTTFFKRVSRTHPVGDDQVAELFFWRLTRWFLMPGGIASLVMPLKSFVNERSREFVAAIGRKMAITSLANLSHMRRRLFRTAIHPAVIVTVSRSEDDRTRGTRIHSPNLAAQPLGRDRRLWTLTTDSSALEIVVERPSHDPERFLHDAFVRRAVDRRICSFLSDQIKHNQLFSIEKLSRYGLIWKSGDQKRRTGLPAEMHLSSKPRSESYLQKHLSRRNERWVSASGSPIVPLTQELLATARGDFPTFFGGNVVAVPRSLKRSYLVVPPAAFNSSFNLFTLKNGHRKSSEKLLQALALYFDSSAFKYLAALNSRQMMIDRWVIELRSMIPLPFPFMGPDDPELINYLSAEPDQRNEIVRRCLKLPHEYWRVIDEFFQERQPFSNGNVPERALVAPKKADLIAYKEVFESRLHALLGSDRFRTEVHDQLLDGLVVLQVRPTWSADESAAISRALVAYRLSEADVFTCSTYVHHDRETDQLFLVKPEQRLYWTRERAYSDVDLLDDVLIRIVNAA